MFLLSLSMEFFTFDVWNGIISLIHSSLTIDVLLDDWKLNKTGNSCPGFFFPFQFISVSLILISSGIKWNIWNFIPLVNQWWSAVACFPIAKRTWHCYCYFMVEVQVLKPCKTHFHVNISNSKWSELKYRWKEKLGATIKECRCKHESIKPE